MTGILWGTQVAFWLLAAGVVWVYAGYPLLLAILKSSGLTLGNRSDPPPADPCAPTPKVSVLVAAYNEEAVIAAKLESLLASDYPADRLEILVASDGSSDGTNEIVASYAARGVKLLDLPRGGKTRALNAAAEQATGDVLVMTDATTELMPDTLRQLVAPFSESGVGCVGAELDYVSEDGSPVGRGTGAYWRYEKAIKGLEAAVCSLIGCSGALYAVRRDAHRPIHPELDDDFTMPWEVYDQGWVTAYAIGVVAREPTNEESGADFRMRVRVALRAINALVRRARYCNPVSYGWFAVQLVSHKLLRYLVPLALLGTLALNVVLITIAPNLLVRLVYAATLLGQMGIYGAAVLGALSQRAGLGLPLVHIPYYFVHLNAAALVAWIRFCLGDRAVTWDTARK